MLLGFLIAFEKWTIWHSTFFDYSNTELVWYSDTSVVPLDIADAIIALEKPDCVTKTLADMMANTQKRGTTQPNSRSETYHILFNLESSIQVV